MSEDPTRFTGGINFYSYVRNHPISRVDPLGLWPSMGSIWNFGKKIKNAWDTATAYADKIGCYAAYYYCIQTTFDNAKCQNQASGNNVSNTITPNDLQNPPGSSGWKNVQDAVSGNPNCEKALKDCLAPLISGGMFPH